MRVSACALLTGLDPSVALFTAGLGILLLQVVTKGKVPIFLASSFAFIAPIAASVQNVWGVPATMGGLMAAGFAYMLLALLVKFKGVATLHKIYRPWLLAQ
ncbi:solute carrier family 23 protein (plasmid) [Pseudoalteromonas espejiana]